MAGAFLLQACGGLAQTEDASLDLPASRSIPFEAASEQLTAVFPIQVSTFDQVVQNSYNWQGETDASLSCQIGFTPEAVVVSGTLLDDQPLVQVYANPARPDWWRIRYAADGVEFRIQDVTSASQALHFTLNFSSAGTAPRIDLLQAPTGVGRGVVETASLELAELERKAQPDGTTPPPPSGFRFRAVLPTAGLLEPKFFAGALQMTVRLHDMDGEFKTYTCLEDKLEKAQ